MIRVRPTWVVLTCALFLNAAPVSIFYDLANSQDNWLDVVANAPIAQSFSTGATAYNLTTVVVVLSNNSNEADARGANRASRVKGHRASARLAKAPNAKPAKVRPAAAPVGSVVVQLWSDNGGPGPNALLATSPTTLLDTSLGNSPAQFTFPFANFPLTANTRYWIVVYSPGGDSVAEWWTTFDSIDGTETSTEYSDYQGDVFPDYLPGDTDEDEAYLMQVIGDPSTPPPTPAPASVTLVLIGLGCAAWYFRRRKVLQSS